MGSLGHLREHPPHLQHPWVLAGAVGGGSAGQGPCALGKWVPPPSWSRRRAASGEDEDGAHPQVMLPHLCILAKQRLCSSIRLELELPAQNLPGRRFLTRRCLHSLYVKSGASCRGPWSGAGCTPLVSRRSHLRVQHAGLLGCVVVPGLSRGVAGGSFPSSSSAPRCSALSLDTRPGLASRAGRRHGAGMRQARPLPVERRSDPGTMPAGLISPTHGPGSHRQSLFFFFAFSFSCGKAGVEKGGGSALASGKITSVLSIPGMRPARVGLRARSLLSSAIWQLAIKLQDISSSRKACAKALQVAQCSGCGPGCRERGWG